jgi:hypothetical protein
MKALPSEILALLQEHKLDVAVEKLRSSVVEALTVQDYDAAVSALLNLSLIQSELAHHPDLSSLGLALTIAGRAGDDSLKAEVLYRRAMFLQAQKDEAGARQAVDEAIVCARQAEAQQLTAQLLQLRLTLNLMGRRDKGDLVEQVRAVVQAYQAAQDMNGQLDALVAGAVLIARQNPPGATTLLNEAEAFLDTIAPKQLERLPQSGAIRMSPSGPKVVHQTPQSDDVKDQWRTYIDQQRAWIAKLSSETQR